MLPPRKFHTEQIFVLVHMQLVYHAKPVKALQGLCNIHSIFKFGMLQVREKKISLRKWPGGTAHAQLRRNTGGNRREFVSNSPEILTLHS